MFCSIHLALLPLVIVLAQHKAEYGSRFLY